MEIIEKRMGISKGRKGITVHLLKQGVKEKGKSFTVHDVTIKDLYNLIYNYLKKYSEENK